MKKKTEKEILKRRILSKKTDLFFTLLNVSKYPLNIGIELPICEENGHVFSCSMLRLKNSKLKTENQKLKIEVINIYCKRICSLEN